MAICPRDTVVLGLDLLPVTRSLSVLSIERLFRRRYAANECFLPNVSGLHSSHTDEESVLLHAYRAEI